MRKHIIGWAIEYMRAAGPRTRERLDDLVCLHAATCGYLHAATCGYTTDLTGLQAEAWAAWEKRGK